jgi:hypothetical protein
MCVGPYTHVIPNLTWIRGTTVGTETRVWTDQEAQLICPSSQFAVLKKTGTASFVYSSNPSFNEQYPFDLEIFYAARVELLDERYRDVFRFEGTSVGGSLPA